MLLFRLLNQRNRLHWKTGVLCA